MADRPVALVTGATSGIGFATASLLAARDYRTFGTSREPGSKPAPQAVEMLQLDVQSDDSAREAVSRVLARAGRIDVLVNNAGFGLFGAVEETSLAEARNQLETNFWGAVRMIGHVLPSMRERGAGRIVNISSVLGFMPVPFQPFYVASKHALEGYSETLSLEVRRFGIFVSLIEPGFVHSSFFDNHLEAQAPLDAYRSERATVSAHLQERTNNGSEPEAVARVVLKAIEAANPSVRYAPGGGLLKVARSLLPTSLFDRGVRRSLQLDPS